MKPLSLFLSWRQLTINKGEGRESLGGPGRKAFYPGREEKRRGEKRDCCCPGVGDLANADSRNERTKQILRIVIASVTEFTKDIFKPEAR